MDARTDIYSVGAVAFFMLTASDLFEAADDVELAAKVLNEEPRRPSAVATQPVPLELDLLVTACLEKRLEDRSRLATHCRGYVEFHVIAKGGHRALLGRLDPKAPPAREVADVTVACRQ